MFLFLNSIYREAGHMMKSKIVIMNAAELQWLER